MVNVPSARKFGFRLELHEGVMRDVLNGSAVKQLLAQTAVGAKSGVETHVRATASPEDAENYAASMVIEESFSDDYGFDFNGPYALGNRPISIIGIPKGRGPNPAAKPPLMVEAETHSLSSVPGFQVGSSGEDVT